MLRITEAQLRAALLDVKNFDVGIVVMHHPLYWLAEGEQGKFEQIIHSKCHMILHGHEHRPRLNQMRGSYGDIIIVPAGATYNRRNPSDPRYINAYNFGLIDLGNMEGEIFHRSWAEAKDTWEADTRFWHNGKAAFHLLPKQSVRAPLARSALNTVQSQYRKALNKRVARKTAFELRHDVVVIDHQPFSKLLIRYTLTLGDGAEEEFEIHTSASLRVLAQASEKVRAQAYELIELKPFFTDVSGVDDFNHEVRRELAEGKGNLLKRTFKITPEIREVSYTYAVLDMPEGVWTFQLGRFSEGLSFSFRGSGQHEYETGALGGLRPAELKEDEFFERYVMEIPMMCLPMQGYLFQWYPKIRKDAEK